MASQSPSEEFSAVPTRFIPTVAGHGSGRGFALAEALGGAQHDAAAGDTAHAIASRLG